jgi:solute carrier family 25 phosphate transporter 23/24/25/41
MCGASSGFVSALVTFPLDVVRRRMQIQALHIEKVHQKNALGIFAEVFTNEGYRGLYRGLTPELMKVVPMVTTMFGVYEYMKDVLLVY